MTQKNSLPKKYSFKIYTSLLYQKKTTIVLLQIKIMVIDTLQNQYKIASIKDGNGGCKENESSFSVQCKVNIHTHAHAIEFIC
jgi:hypothetical protein